MMGRCKYCDRPIDWVDAVEGAETKRVPLDARAITYEWFEEIRESTTPGLYETIGYYRKSKAQVPHWLVCPNRPKEKVGKE